MAPTSHSHIGRELYAPGCLERIKSGGGGKICYPSHKTTFVCLPVPSKPLTRLGEHTMATAPSLLSLSVSFPTLLYSLPFCSSSFASTMQTFRGLSAPPLLGELQHKTSLCGQVSSGTRIRGGTNRQTPRSVN